VEKEKSKENWGQVRALGAKRKLGKTNLQVPSTHGSNTERHNEQAKETTARPQAGAQIEESKSRTRNKNSGSALRETKIRASIWLQQVRKTGRAQQENEKKISGVSSTRDENPATRTEVPVSRRRTAKNEIWALRRGWLGPRIPRRALAAGSQKTQREQEFLTWRAEREGRAGTESAARHGNR
jgi:hypothetical protein